MGTSEGAQRVTCGNTEEAFIAGSLKTVHTTAEDSVITDLWESNKDYGRNLLKLVFYSSVLIQRRLAYVPNL